MAKHANSASPKMNETDTLLLRIATEVIKLNDKLDLILSVTKVGGKHLEGYEAQDYDGHEYTTGKYDWGVSVNNKEQVVVTAYALELDKNGDVKSVDTQTFVSFYTFMNVENVEKVGYLLKDASWWNKKWVDYEDWVEEEFLTSFYAPVTVQTFVKYMNKLSLEEFKKLSKEQNQ